MILTLPGPTYLCFMIPDSAAASATITTTTIFNNDNNNNGKIILEKEICLNCDLYIMLDV